MAAQRSIDRATLARLAAHERWARVPDRAAATAPARQAAEDRFLRLAAELHPGADAGLIRKAAENLRSAHAIRAARARWNKKVAPLTNGTTLEVDRDFTTTPHRRAS